MNEFVKDEETEAIHCNDLTMRKSSHTLSMTIESNPTPHQQHDHTNSSNITTKIHCSSHVPELPGLRRCRSLWKSHISGSWTAMRRHQGPVCRTTHSFPRCTNMAHRYTQYTAYQDTWPSDSLPVCKDVTSVREPVETASSLSHHSLFLSL